jgi:hypothetical protein
VAAIVKGSEYELETRAIIFIWADLVAFGQDANIDNQ